MHREVGDVRTLPRRTAAARVVVGKGDWDVEGSLLRIHLVVLDVEVERDRVEA